MPDLHTGAASLSPAAGTGPPRSPGWGRWLTGLGVLTFASGGFLVAMYASLAAGGSADPWGPINDALGAVGNVLLAAAIPMLSRRAARRRWERLLVYGTTVVSLVAAVSGALLVVGALAFEPSTAFTVAAIVVQAGWLWWLNRRYATDPAVPRSVHRFGRIVAVTLLAGMVLVGASFAFPWGSPVAYALLIPGVVGGGIAWLGWPAWYLLLGRYLSTAAPADARG
ncbi:hypothetical protein [Granulicoccus phenolivorans]|uniref:hypothetical protein n=1 Tax=Granulicoccus phenolivorans TaxID=266854 RepID=UPI00047A307F|nr:hypothetical protein [Granulicoccus phenolivorans]